jgi:DNA primase
LQLLANFIPEDKISEIKNAADIVDIVSEAVLLKKTGKNYVGLCPFHAEKTPSFTVSTDKQIFYCFGCGTGGNVFSFLMKQEGLSFPEAVRRLARRYSIDIPDKALSPEQKRQINERENLLGINREAMVFFNQVLLKGGVGRRAKNYLDQRGISDQTIDDFKLGYAPDGWDNLLNFFSKKRVVPATVEKVGLVVARKNKSGYYDRFRNRIIFPIFDGNRQVVGFGGRVLDDSLPKYLNSPETPVYNKSRSLYGIHRAKDKCRATGTVFIVEGYLDLLALHQHGIENCVATLGTALTAQQVRILSRFASRIVLVYDSDEAGLRSAVRCIETFWQEHVDFRRQDVFREEKADTHIMVLPSGHDPDSYVFEYGPEAFLEAASKAPGIITFLMDCAIRKNGLSTEGKIRIIADMQAPLAAINDSVARALYIKQVAERIGIDERAVAQRVGTVGNLKTVPGRYAGNEFSGSGKSDAAGSARVAETDGRGSRTERKIIAMMLQYSDVLPEIKALNILKYFENTVLKKIGEFILERYRQDDGQVSELISRMDRQQQQIIAELAMVEESWNMKGCLRLLGRFVETRRKGRESGVLDEQIRAAEKSNDQMLLLTLLKQKQKMAIRSEQKKMAILNEK